MNTSPKKQPKTSALSLEFTWCNTQTTLDSAIQMGLTDRYCDIFAEPPYLEYFEPQGVSEYFKSIQRRQGAILTGVANNNVISFAASLPLDQKPDIVQVLPDNIDPKKSCYFAEDAVAPDYRRQGISARMKKLLMKFNRESGFTTMVLRTSNAPGNAQLAAMRQIPGTEQIRNPDNTALLQSVSSLRLNGTETPDTRCFFKIDLTKI